MCLGSGSAWFQASLLLLFAEVLERRGVDAFPPENGSDLSAFFAGIDQPQDAQFVLAAIATTDRFAFRSLLGLVAVSGTADIG